MTRTSQIVEDVANHYNHLLAKHKKLHDEIEHCQYYTPDAELTVLKKKKLHLKDEIETIKQNLLTLVQQ